MEPTNSKIFVHHIEDTTVVTFNDEKILEPEYIKELEESIMLVLEQARRLNLVLDLCNVKFMSSAVLGLLIKIHKKTCDRKGHLELCNMDPKIYTVFKTTRLDKVFDISQKQD
jgi:anti-sigma B factor antagonist